MKNKNRLILIAIATLIISFMIYFSMGIRSRDKSKDLIIAQLKTELEFYKDLPVVLK